MDISVSLARWSLIPIFLILFNVKIKRDKHFKICTVSLIFVIFLKFFFLDYQDFLITKMIYLFLMLYALQLLLEWDKLLKLMGVNPENEE